MLELAADLLEREHSRHRVAVATVTRITGSAPRTLGTSMAVDDAGAVIGSISGGCVEGAVYDVCQAVLASGVPELVEFGYSDDDAFAVGLACGGRIEVLVRRLDLRGDDALFEQLQAAADGRSAGVALVVSGSGLGSVVTAGGRTPGPAEGGNDRRIRTELAGRIARGQTVLDVVSCDDEAVEVLFVVSLPPPRMIIFGAVDFSAALADAAALMGYAVTVCDARAVFTTAGRFPSAESVVVEWPSDYLARTAVDRRTVVCILTHDDKFDVPLIEVALGLDLAYVGAMGSRQTHERRLRLLEARVASGRLARLHSPIGLDIGASSPQETAVSILAEVIASRTGATTLPLSEVEGPIHRARLHQT